MRDTLLRTLVVVLVATPALAQTRSTTLTAGFAVPIDHHYIGKETRSSPNSVTPTVWAEVSFPLVLPRLSFHSGVEFPLIPFKMIFIHQGSAGYRADISNRDIVLSQLIGVRIGEGRAHAIGLVGGALVFSRRVADLTIPGRLLPTGLRDANELRTDIETDVSVAVMGGMDVPIQVNERVAITPRVRLRVAIPRTYRPYARVGVSPGVGVQFRF